MKVEKGQLVDVHYTGTLEDGSEFDSSHKRGEPIRFIAGNGQMISGFDDAIIGMGIGEKKRIVLPPDEAYGDHLEMAMGPVPKSSFPSDFEFIPGIRVQGMNNEGQPILATIVEEDRDNVIMDFNNPLAGKTLKFELELIDIINETKE